MIASRILDAVWCLCGELARRESEMVSAPWTRDGILREAAACVLASQVPHAMAVAALERLAARHLLPPSGSVRWQRRAATCLASPLSEAFPRAYRFPQQAAERLASVGKVADRLIDIVVHRDDLAAARRELTSLRCGLGPKQASLLLRNVRTGVELAVLDVHLLAFMRIAGLTTAAKVPPVLTGYEDLEDRFRCYASGLGVSMHHLDVAAWVVMRAARPKETAWAS